MPRGHPRKITPPQVLGQLLAKGFDPVLALLEMAVFNMELSEADLASPVIQSLLGGDYEALPTGDGRYRLQVRTKLRLESAATLLRFSHPMMKAVENRTEVNAGITITIKSFRDAEPMAALPVPKVATIDLPADVTPLQELSLSTLPVSSAKIEMAGEPLVPPVAVTSPPDETAH